MVGQTKANASRVRFDERGLAPCVVQDSPGKIGFSMQRHLVAQGDGRLEGDRIPGVLTFSQLAKRFAEETFCTTFITGFLETDAGPEIFYEGLGYATPRTKDRWSYTASVLFEEPEPPYEWLQDLPAVWQGELDGPGRRVRYRVFVPVEAPSVSAAPSFGWEDNRDPELPRVSPNAVVGVQLGSARVMVAYGRPALKGRSFEDHYGRLWRTGADEATTVTFTGDVHVEGHTAPAGTYALLTIPGKDRWTFILNEDPNQWTTDAYDRKRDVLRVEVPARGAPYQERLEFRFDAIDTDAGTASLVLHWGETEAALRLKEEW